jgi:hypothetical protein
MHPPNYIIKKHKQDFKNELIMYINKKKPYSEYMMKSVYEDVMDELIMYFQNKEINCFFPGISLNR